MTNGFDEMILNMTDTTPEPEGALPSQTRGLPRLPPAPTPNWA